MQNRNRLSIIMILLVSLLVFIQGMASAANSPDGGGTAEIVKTVEKDGKVSLSNQDGKGGGSRGKRGISHRERLQTGFQNAEAILGKILGGGKGFFATLGGMPGEIWSVVDRLTEKQGAGPFFRMLLGCLLVILAGLLGELGIRKCLTPVNRGTESDSDRFPRVVTCLIAGAKRFLVDFLGVITYALTTFLIAYFFYDSGGYAYLMVTTLLIASYSVQVTRLACGVVLSPNNAMLRLLPFCDVSAPLVSRRIITIAAVSGFIGASADIFGAAGGSRASFLLLYSCAGLSVVILLILLVLKFKKIKEAHFEAGAACVTEEHPEGVRPTRYVLAILYILTIWVFWEIGLFQNGTDMAGKSKLSLLLLPLFMTLDYWGRRMLDLMAEKAGAFYGVSPEEDNTKEISGETQELGISDTESNDLMDTSNASVASGVSNVGEGAMENGKPGRWSSDCYLPLMKKTLRIFIFGTLFFTVMHLWGIGLMRVRSFTLALGGIFLILVTWEFSKVTIQRRLEQEMPDSDEDMDEGGAGGSRVGTILVLMKKMIAAVLIGLASLLALSALGIDIGPLVAGAGILGLAIGFGAQTLVKDIISGIFFLVDDAFRIGDYVDTGKVKGTVEQISLRSLRLRHHRGMVHTIPFGELGSVTNFSRDYIIMKLDFRVRYDTDIDKVRKIIKKMGKKIAANEEQGPKLLSPIKSQGVKALDDSAMIMRIKFKSIPGEQFVLRREIFRRVQEAFRENGIAFAHRNVTVYLPGEEQDGVPGKEKVKKEANKPNTAGTDLKRLAAGAGLAAIEAEEKKQQLASGTQQK